MISKLIQGDIFLSNHQHIVFAVNTNGFNDSGFAGEVSERYWPELANTGPKKLGEVLHKKAADKHFHAIVCHSLNAGGWNRSPEFIEKSINALKIKKGETIGVVLMGAGMVGRMMGADVDSIIFAMKRTNKHLTVYTL